LPPGGAPPPPPPPAAKPLARETDKWPISVQVCPFHDLASIHFGNYSELDTCPSKLLCSQRSIMSHPNILVYLLNHPVQHGLTQRAVTAEFEQKNKPKCQQTASTIPKYNSSMNIHSPVVESLTCGQMKTLTHVNAVWLRTGQRLCISVTTVTTAQISLLEERPGKDRALRNLLIHRHHNSA